LISRRGIDSGLDGRLAGGPDRRREMRGRAPPRRPALAMAAFVLAGVAFAMVGFAAPVRAQSDPLLGYGPAAGVPAEALTGVLARIRRAGVVTLGYREHALPFSVGAPGRTPYGYSIDLCLAIVEDIAEATGGRPLRVAYRRVTPEDRIELIERGEIDLECGATTQTAERRARVAFSPLTFVTGTRLAVPRGSALRARRDLDGQRIAVARGTTNEQAIREQIARSGLRTDVVAMPDVAEAFARVAAGGADAVASDEVLLLGYMAETGQRARWDLVGELLSYERYGIMFARDDAPLAAVVTSTFERLARTRELRWIYLRWFVRQLPPGVKFGLPMGPELTRAFELLGLPPD
jgi:glutamate/aspartate transport system substrate-binding protein